MDAWVWTLVVEWRRRIEMDNWTWSPKRVITHWKRMHRFTRGWSSDVRNEIERCSNSLRFLFDDRNAKKRLELVKIPSDGRGFEFVDPRRRAIGSKERPEVGVVILRRIYHFIASSTRVHNTLWRGDQFILDILSHIKLLYCGLGWNSDPGMHADCAFSSVHPTISFQSFPCYSYTQRCTLMVRKEDVFVFS